MSVVREVVSDIYTWSEFSEEKQLNFNGYYVVKNGESALIDPPELDEQGMQELDSLIAKNNASPLKGILLTNVHHDRMSQKLKQKYSVPIWINAQDKDLLEFSPDHGFSGGDAVFCGLKVIALAGQKSPGESAFLLAGDRVLLVGDALIGKVPGAVNLLPPDKYADIQAAKEGLRVLQNVDFDTLLVGDGDSILKNAKQVVMDFLKS